MQLPIGSQISIMLIVTKEITNLMIYVWLPFSLSKAMQFIRDGGVISCDLPYDDVLLLYGIKFHLISTIDLRKVASISDFGQAEPSYGWN